MNLGDTEIRQPSQPPTHCTAVCLIDTDILDSVQTQTLFREEYSASKMVDYCAQ